MLGGRALPEPAGGSLLREEPTSKEGDGREGRKREGRRRKGRGRKREVKSPTSSILL